MGLAIWKLLLPSVVLGRTGLIRLRVQLLAATVGSFLASELLLGRFQMLTTSHLRTQHAAPAAPLASPLRIHDPSTVKSLHDSAEDHLQDSVSAQGGL